MTVRYAHTNIIAKDWKNLARFYTDIFSCAFVPPQRNQSGQWLEDGTGVKGAAVEGVHLRLPGWGDSGPTLEIYSYSKMEDSMPAVANRKGFGHLAFEVSDVESFVAKVNAAGGKSVGKIVTRDVPGAGQITFTYVSDPEGNMIELQTWKKFL